MDHQPPARIETNVRAGDRAGLLEVLRALADFPDRHAAARAAETALLSYIGDDAVTATYARIAARDY